MYGSHFPVYNNSVYNINMVLFVSHGEKYAFKPCKLEISDEIFNKCNNGHNMFGFCVKLCKERFSEKIPCRLNGKTLKWWEFGFFMISGSSNIQVSALYAQVCLDGRLCCCLGGAVPVATSQAVTLVWFPCLPSNAQCKRTSGQHTNWQTLYQLMKEV